MKMEQLPDLKMDLPFEIAIFQLAMFHNRILIPWLIVIPIHSTRFSVASDDFRPCASQEVAEQITQLGPGDLLRLESHAASCHRTWIWRTRPCMEQNISAGNRFFSQRSKTMVSMEVIVTGRCKLIFSPIYGDVQST